MVSCLGAISVKGQFFGQIYYPQSGCELTSGCRTTINSAGYLMGSYRGSSIGTQADFYIAKTDNVGAFTGTSEFVKEYFIYDDEFCFTGVRTNMCSGVSAIETSGNNGETYAIAASYFRGVIFAILDNAGNILVEKGLNFPTATGWWMPPPSMPTITESVGTPGEYYVCGNWEKSTYVFKVNKLGNVLWRHFYDSYRLQAKAMIESPYNSGELVLVGITDPDPFVYGTLAADSFFLKLNSGTGAPGTWGSVITYNTYGDGAIIAGDQWFSSIAPAASTYGGSNGYVIGGFSSALSASIFGPTWMVKLDPNGAIIWNTLIPSAHLNSTFDAHGVLERYNTAGFYEYYGVSNTYANSTNKITVFKLDDSGARVTGTNNEFIYQVGGGMPFYGNYITSINTNSTDDGIQVFGTDFYNNSYFVKAYFNGVSGCNDSLITRTPYFTGPSSIISPTIAVTDPFSECPFGYFYLTTNSITVTPSVLCGTTSIPSGNNSKSFVASVNKDNVNESIFKIFPNPSNGKTNLTFSAKETDDLEIKLFNSLGQFVAYIQNPVHTTGTDIKKIEIDLSKMELSNGIYYISAIVNGTNSKCKLVYLRN